MPPPVQKIILIQPVDKLSANFHVNTLSTLRNTCPVECLFILCMFAHLNISLTRRATDVSIVSAAVVMIDTWLVALARDIRVEATLKFLQI